MRNRTALVSALSLGLLLAGCSSDPAPQSTSSDAAKALATQKSEQKSKLAKLTNASTPEPNGSRDLLMSATGPLAVEVNGTAEVRVTCGGTGGAAIRGDNGRLLWSTPECKNGQIYGVRIPAAQISRHVVSLGVDPKTQWTLGVWTIK